MKERFNELMQLGKYNLVVKIIDLEEYIYQLNIDIKELKKSLEKACIELTKEREKL